jgi:hypothetical protein
MKKKTVKNKEGDMKDREYFAAYIGPIDRVELDKTNPMGEGKLRSYLQQAFHEVAGHWADTCSSGWGVKPDMIHHLSFAHWDEDTKKGVVDSYIWESKKMPRCVKAWYLLLESEGVYKKGDNKGL